MCRGPAFENPDELYERTGRIYTDYEEDVFRTMGELQLLQEIEIHRISEYTW